MKRELVKKLTRYAQNEKLTETLERIKNKKAAGEDGFYIPNGFNRIRKLQFYTKFLNKPYNTIILHCSLASSKKVYLNVVQKISPEEFT